MVKKDITTEECEFREAVGENIRFRRQRLRMSQRQLAVKIGVTRSAVVNLEHGRFDTGIVRLRRVASALDTSITDLVGELRAYTRRP